MYTDPWGHGHLVQFRFILLLRLTALAATVQWGRHMQISS